jgi:hypothetical protein
MQGRAQTHDVALAAARTLLYLGLFASSLLSVRVGPLTAGDLFLVASAGLLLLAARKPRGQQADTVLHIGLWLILLGGTLAGLHAISFSEHTGVLLRLVYLIVVLPWQLGSLLETQEQLSRGALWWAAGAATMGIGTLLQAEFGTGLVVGGGVKNGRFTGFAEHVSDAGGVAVLALVFGLAMYAGGERRRRRLALTIMVLGTVGVVLSGSVSAMLASVLVAGWLLLTGRLRLTRAGGVALVVFGGLLVVTAIQAATPSALTPWERFMQTTGRQSYVAARPAELNTSASRVDVISAAMDERMAHPFVGSGFDAESATVEGDEFDNQPHNILVGAFYRGGLFTLIGLALIVGAGLRRALRLPKDDPLATALASAFLAAVAFAMTAPSLYGRYFWIPLAFVLVAHRSAIDATRRRPTTRRQDRRQRRLTSA